MKHVIFIFLYLLLMACSGGGSSSQDEPISTSIPTLRPESELDTRVRKPFNVESRRLSAGSGHACIIAPGGKVRCWGSGRYGVLGDGRTENSAFPVTVMDGENAPLKDVVQQSSGEESSCALFRAGQVKCWGRGIHGQLGHGSEEDSNYPVNVLAGGGLSGNLTGIVQVGTGGNHSCALTSTGRVICWGAGNAGPEGEPGEFELSRHCVDQ